MSKLTHVSNNSDWEALYIDGEKVADQHLGRLWPNLVLKIIEGNDIDEVEKMNIEPGESFPSDLSDSNER